MPPWTDPGDIPLPPWARSVVPHDRETPVFAAPGKIDQKRGVLAENAHLPLYGAKRGASCLGRWLEIGPLAWVCSDMVDLSADAPESQPRGVYPDGLPYRYYFVGRDGAWAFAHPETADSDQPDQELEAGWGVAIVDEKPIAGKRWGRTSHGRWVEMSALVPSRPSAFHGEDVKDGKIDFAWVSADKTTARSLAKSKTALTSPTHVRFEKVPWREERVVGNVTMTRISDDGVDPEAWVPSKDLAHPTIAPPPADLGPGERWVDVDLATQTVIAYEGTTPVFATLMSAGKGAQGTDTATPRGTHRLWVKLQSTDMGNMERDDVDQHYSIEDVPFVQFFDHAVGLHGAFWHREFGRVRSHGCVNLAPLDATRLFDFTWPHLPRGWTAVFPTELEKGSLVRVR
ncbi:MAG TPA: L,D-transpeptidase [Polyangiaceae bacterium]